jgi:hypothetical protein
MYKKKHFKKLNKLHDNNSFSENNCLPYIDKLVEISLIISYIYVISHLKKKSQF